MKTAFAIPFFQTSSSLTLSNINPSLPVAFMPLPCFLHTPFFNHITFVYMTQLFLPNPFFSPTIFTWAHFSPDLLFHEILLYPNPFLTHPHLISPLHKLYTHHFLVDTFFPDPLLSIRVFTWLLYCPSSFLPRLFFYQPLFYPALFNWPIIIKLTIGNLTLVDLTLLHWLLCHTWVKFSLAHSFFPNLTWAAGYN